MPAPPPSHPASSLLGHPPNTPTDETLEAAWAALDLWRLDEARSLLATLPPSPLPQGPALLLVQALLARREPRSQAARTLFEQAWSQTSAPSHLHTLVGIESAHHLQQLGEVEAAATRLAACDTDGPLRPRWLLAASQLDLQQGRPELARQRLDEALAQALEQGDLLRTESARLALASLHGAQGRYPPAEQHAAQALELSLAHAHTHSEGQARHMLAQLATQQGDYARATQELLTAEARFVQVGDTRGRAASLRLMAELEARAGRPAQAQDRLNVAITLLDALGDRRGRAATLHEQAILCHQQGLRGRARVLLDEVLRESRALGDRQAEAASLHLLAQVELKEGANDKARALLSSSAEVLKALGNRTDWAASMVMLGQLDARQGQLEQGIQRLQEAVVVLRELGSGMLRPAEQALAQLVSARSGTSTEVFRQLLSEGEQALERGQLRVAEQAASKALDLSKSSARPDVEAIAHFQLAQILMAQGKMADARPHLVSADLLLGRQGRVEQQAVVRVLLERSRKG